MSIDRVAKFILWMNACPDYESLFSILDGLRHDPDRRFWIESFVTPEDNCDVEEDTGQVNTGVEIVLDNRRGVRTMKGMHFKSEIAQRELSDLCRKPSVG